MICKYCKEEMMGQDNDPFPGGYSKLYVCLNNDCRAIFEEWTDKKHRRTPDKDRWFNPKTKEFEDI